MDNQSPQQSATRTIATSAKERLARYGDRTGPGSALQAIIGDVSAFYAAMPILVNVVLSEAGSKGVDDHDRVANLANRDHLPFEAFVGRFLDTADLVGGFAFVSEEQRALLGETIREIHRHVEGRLEGGSRYHAWNGPLWAWTWAGILQPTLRAYEQLHGKQSPEFLEDAYIGALQLGNLFGVRGLPDTYAEFQGYLQGEWFETARKTGTGEFLLSLLHDVPLPEAAPWLPRLLWNARTWPLRNLLLAGVFISFEPRTRELLGLRPTRGHQLSVALHLGLFRSFMKMRLRYGNNSWNSHYSPESLARYRKQVTEARAQGLPQPRRASKRR